MILIRIPCEPPITIQCSYIKRNSVVIISDLHTVATAIYYHVIEKLSGLGRFLECWKCNICITYNTSTFALPDIYAFAFRYWAHSSNVHIIKLIISGKAHLSAL